tara:strand:+ start:647 stop:949 length:303 start_codon:yes stop_codon:yes gene_type:complete
MKQDPREVTLFEIERNIDNLDSLDDLEKIQDYLTHRRKKLARANGFNLIVGQKVRINGSGKVDRGKIVKINKTRAVVDCYDKYRDQMVHYTVPFSMIRVD